MLRYYITDRRQLISETLLESIERNAAAGVDYIQLREKDLSARELFALAEAACRITERYGAKLIVNTRVDIAIATGADGVHFPERSPEPSVWRSIVPARFVFGVSCHSMEDAIAAEAGGADYVLFGPVYTPLSKASELAPRGLAGLRDAAGAVDIPVLALGGITQENAPACSTAGAAGVAGISRFQTAKV